MKRFFLIVLAVLAVASCSKDSGKGNVVEEEGYDNTRAYIEMTGNFSKLSVANSDLAFSVFAALNEYVGENETPVLLSPVSLSFALGMLNNGAANETRDALMSVLGGDCADIDEMNGFYHTLASQLTTLDKTTTLKIANSQWSIPEFELLPEYSNAVFNYFDADLYTLNFSTAVSDINNWCSDKTDGLIKDFYSDGEINDDIKTILLDALYFKGAWKDEFDKDDTYEDTFTNYDGSESTVSYMSRTLSSTGVKTAENYKAFSFSFGNGAFSLQILLPNEGVSLSDCISSLNTDEWLDWKYYSEREVLLPKFSVEYKGYLDDVLGTLGLESALDGGDYSNMSSVTFDNIVRVKQATKFSIDEEGAEAAAVTSDELWVTSPGEPQEPEMFYVTRPFLYIVKENSSNTILFIGRITKL